MSTPQPARTLDLRGIGCPLNYVKTRVALDAVGPGGCVEVWLDHGEPEENADARASLSGRSGVPRARRLRL